MDASADKQYADVNEASRNTLTMLGYGKNIALIPKNPIIICRQLKRGGEAKPGVVD